MAKIVIRYNEERWRGVAGNRTGGNSQRPWIDRDLKVSSAIHALDGICRLRVSLSRAVNEHGHDLTTGRKSHHTDPLLVQVPLRRSAANQTHCTLHILARMDVEG